MIRNKYPEMGGGEKRHKHMLAWAARGGRAMKWHLPPSPTARSGEGEAASQYVYKWIPFLQEVEPTVLSSKRPVSWT